MNKKRIYLDYGASTPVNPKVIEAMLPYWTDFYGNPSSSHEHGRVASVALENARQTFAELTNVLPKELFLQDVAPRAIISLCVASCGMRNKMVAAII